MIASDLRSTAPHFEAFLIDQFGVLLDGGGAISGASEALSWLSAQSKPTVLLSNSGKRSRENENRLTAHGFCREDYICVMSSGEAAYRVLSRRAGTVSDPGLTVWTHSRDNDLSHIAGLDLNLTEHPENADLLLLAGVQNLRLTLQDYERILRPAAARNIPCLCSNPDMKRLTSGGIRFAPGRIAALYEELGGKVEWIGKPYPLIYSEAAALLPGIPPEKILCIGDSPDHDVIGGGRAGHKTALVRTGLYADLTDEAFVELCNQQGAAPDFVIPALSIAKRGA